MVKNVKHTGKQEEYKSFHIFPAKIHKLKSFTTD